MHFDGIEVLLYSCWGIAMSLTENTTNLFEFCNDRPIFCASKNSKTLRAIVTHRMLSLCWWKSTKKRIVFVNYWERETANCISHFHWPNSHFQTCKQEFPKGSWKQQNSSKISRQSLEECWLSSFNMKK